MSRKELKIVQLVEKKKGKTEKIKYPPIPAKDVTYAVQVSTNVYFHPTKRERSTSGYCYEVYSHGISAVQHCGCVPVRTRESACMTGRLIEMACRESRAQRSGLAVTLLAYLYSN